MRRHQSGDAHVSDALATAVLRELVSAREEWLIYKSYSHYHTWHASARRRLDAAWDRANALVHYVKPASKPSRFKPGQKIVCVVDHVNLDKGRVYVVQQPCWPDD